VAREVLTVLSKRQLELIKKSAIDIKDARAALLQIEAHAEELVQMAVGEVSGEVHINFDTGELSREKPKSKRRSTNRVAAETNAKQ